MTVAYGAADGLPHVCAVYTCECGARAATHGREAGALPSGWQVREGSAGEPAHLCPRCGRRIDRSRPAPTAVTPP